MTPGPAWSIAAALQAYEPDYRFLATFGDSILPQLEEIIAGTDEALASRALLLAIQIGGSQAIALVLRYRNDPRPQLRAVLAARGAKLGVEPIMQMLPVLLGDPDPSIRRLAAGSAAHGDRRILAHLRQLEATDAEPMVRRAATAAIRSIEAR